LKRTVIGASRRRKKQGRRGKIEKKNSFGTRKSLLNGETMLVKKKIRCKGVEKNRPNFSKVIGVQIRCGRNSWKIRGN